MKPHTLQYLRRNFWRIHDRICRFTGRIPGANVDGSHVSMAAGMGAMCGADDDKPVYDGSVSLSYADGREIGCAKCRELFVADVKRKPPTYPTPKGTST